MTDRVVNLTGEMTIQNAAEVLAGLKPVMGDLAVLNLSDVSEMDTAGLQILLLLKSQAVAEHRSFELVSPSDPVVEVLRTAGLGTDLEVEK